MSGSIVGTPIHMAPELFTGTPARCVRPPSCYRRKSGAAVIGRSHPPALLLLLFVCPTGKYDNSVDVYAFGILFWYLCTGSVKLPEAFEKCSSKDQLWNNVKKGKAVVALGFLSFTASFSEMIYGFFL